MDSAVAMIDTQTGIESLYRTDADRLWRAVYAFAGDAEIASDAVAEAYAQLLHRGAAVRTRRPGCGGPRSRSAGGP